MKRIIVVLVLVFLISNLSNAQFYKGFGVKVGTSIANQETEVIGSFLRYKFGFTVGIFKEAVLYDNLNLIVGVNYTQKGAREPFYETSETGLFLSTKYFHRTIHMATFDIIAKYNGNNEKISPYIMAGLRRDFFISATNSFDGNELSPAVYRYPLSSKATFGGIIGFGIDYSPTKSVTTFIEGTYNPDFTYIGEERISILHEKWTVKNYSFEIKTGIKF